MRFLHLRRRRGGDLHHIDARLAGKAFHHGRIRRDDGVVLILSHHVAALFFEHAGDFERHVLDANHLTDRFAVREKIVDDGLSEHRDFR